MGEGFAFIRLADGTGRIGWGPFGESDTPVDGACFYVNNWRLSDARPWKIPDRIEAVDDLGTLISESGEPLSVTWTPPTFSEFEPAFREVSEWIRSGKTRKMVPVVSEWGEFTGPQAGRRLAAKIANAASPLCPYGYVLDDAGFVGATPEILFSRRGSDLKTMALAGTVPTAGRAAFLGDTKEIGEHEMVVEHIVACLAEFGAVERSPRMLLDLEGLSHFCSHIRARIPDLPATQDLIDRLHPTPAVGTLPATEILRRRLWEIRESMGTPEWFGAPFGYAERDDFHCVVAIRGVGWEGNSAVIPSGCGIVEGSDLGREWDELALKRNSVKQLFGL